MILCFFLRFSLTIFPNFRQMFNKRETLEPTGKKPYIASEGNVWIRAKKKKKREKENSFDGHFIL